MVMVDRGVGAVRETHSSGAMVPWGLYPQIHSQRTPNIQPRDLV